MNVRPIQFRVYPERDRYYYFTVLVFQRRDQMFVYHDEQQKILGYEDAKHDFLAICKGWRHIKDGELCRDIGTVLFCQKACRVGIVSHEMSHATIHWASVVMEKPSRVFSEDPKGREHNESFCWALGNLVRQFWRGYQRRLARQLDHSL